MQLTNNTILITGGTSGLGLAFAERFYQLGNKVIVTGRRQERMNMLEEKYPGMITKFCEMTDEAQRNALVKSVTKEFPELNVFINNAGVQLISDFTKPIELPRVHEELETNIVAPLHLATALVPHLSKKENGVIINVTSGLSFVPLARVALYSATKAAFRSLTMSLRYQLRYTTVKVVEMIPPQVDTELGAELRGGQAGTHGGMPVADFLAEAMAGLEKGDDEVTVGHAKNLREKRKTAFGFMNPA